jgi:fatty acid desaturase
VPTPIDFAAIAGRLLPEHDALLPELRRRRPLRVWLDTLRCFSLIAGAFFLLGTSAGLWWAPVCFALIGSQQLALLIQMHDAKHRLLFASVPANERYVRWLLSPLIGASIDLSAERRVHGQHHRFLARERDPERRLYTLRDGAGRSEFVWFALGLATAGGAVRKILCGGIATAESPVSWCQRAQAWGPLLIAQGLTFAAIISFFPWWYYPVFWLGPIYPMVYVAQTVRVFSEHAQLDTPGSVGEELRLYSFRPNFVERTFLAPMNMNYHAEHHLWPTVPYYNLPRLSRLVPETELIVIRRSYLGFLVSYFHALRQGGHELSLARRSVGMDVKHPWALRAGSAPLWRHIFRSPG